MKPWLRPTAPSSPMPRRRASRGAGALIQPMRSGIAEAFAGVVCDPLFGPAVVFGLGGIFVEVLKDTVTEMAPLSHADAIEMITRIKGASNSSGRTRAAARRHRCACCDPGRLGGLRHCACRTVCCAGPQSDHRGCRGPRRVRGRYRAGEPGHIEHAAMAQEPSGWFAQCMNATVIDELPAYREAEDAHGRPDYLAGSHIVGCEQCRRVLAGYIRQQLPEPYGSACGSAWSRQRDRHPGARHRRQADGHLGAAGHRREQAWNSRHRQRSEQPAGRLHAAGQFQWPHHRGRGLQESLLRSRQGFCRGDAARVGAADADRAAGPASPDGRRIRCAGEAEARSTQLRLARRRQRSVPGCPAVQARGQDRHRPCALQELARGDHQRHPRRLSTCIISR